MKRTSFPATGLLLIITLIATHQVLATDSPSKRPDQDEVIHQLWTAGYELPTQPPKKHDESQEAILLGRMAAERLMRTLGGQMKTHLQESGPAGALGFCAAKAQELTAQVNRELPEGVKVKRISLRYRNPVDAPKEDEAKVLQALHLLRDTGVILPGHILQKTGPHSYKFYKPITINKGVCLNCHGDVALMKPGVKRALARLYPGDRATGYRLGNLRGAVVTTIKRR